MTLNVLYEFSDLYAPYAGISILSLFYNNKDMDEITVYVLDDEIGNINKEKLNSLAVQYQRKIVYLETRQIANMLKGYNVPLYKGSYSTYYKLFGLKLLPKDIKQILYLDSDTIVLDNLRELAEFELEDSPCAMVIDPILDKYKDILGIGRNSRYYNCGMGIFNIPLWNEKCEKEILDLLRYDKSGFFIMDQDIINLLYSRQIKTLPLRYNLTGVFTLYSSDDIYWLYGYSEHTMYSKAEIDNAVKAPAVCHYIAYQAGRPWEIDNIHPMTKYYDTYWKMSPWSDSPKIKGKCSKLIKIQRTCYKLLPRKIYILIHKMILTMSMKHMAKKAESKYNGRQA